MGDSTKHESQGGFFDQYRLPAYESAILEVIRGGIYAMSGGHALFTDRRTGYAMPEVNMEASGQLVGDTVISNEQQIEHEVEIKLSECLQGNYGGILERLSGNASTVAEQLDRAKLRAVAATCKAAGQEKATGAGENAIELFLMGIEGTDIGFDEQEQPQFDSCVMVREEGSKISKTPYDVLIELLDREGTAAQKQRFEAIIKAQRDDWLAGRRPF